MFPFSTELMQIFSKSSENFFNLSFLSIVARWFKALDQAKIDAIGLVEVAIPFLC